MELALAFRNGAVVYLDGQDVARGPPSLPLPAAGGGPNIPAGRAAAGAAHGPGTTDR